jgi:hypothetical protein
MHAEIRKGLATDTSRGTLTLCAVFVGIAVLIYISRLRPYETVKFSKPAYLRSYDSNNENAAMNYNKSKLTKAENAVPEDKTNTYNTERIHTQNIKPFLGDKVTTTFAMETIIKTKESEWKNMQLERKQRLDKVCTKYGKETERPILAERYTLSPEHKLLYCRNAKVGTTTWNVSTFNKIKRTAR